ncbi:Fpg/Nei family DNA glycosylase [Aeromicrobium chenweiae]|uniref:DNA-(apurinic or apyrimidinic site) lyase n=1 Tax=Aeromicrobium chenweiae TaxID=2079793 RepID=A0A2S0WK50_9ACTN|nr:DNA-formamidopyrimidine glycosylase family protein [Aeromicrobium chenweiae]AWB91677.1 DNA glycosylase [Aeromicrobium chenweiae]TGN32517.1 Fpg/Nei family DNA glycosylase [Aeromicrobium chenweiae]
MPEGHTLHRLAADLAAAYAGRRVTSTSPQGRFALEARRLDGRVLEGTEAYGKHLFVSFDGTEEQVHVHLGLYGTFLISPGTGRPVVGQVRWRLEAEDTADLRGPNACELLTPPEVALILARLGPDPLRADADPDRAWHRIHRSSTPIAALLMDQKVLAGVGNVYRAEVLFRQGVAPMTAGRRIPRVRWDAIWSDLVALMEIGVERGRIDTVRPEHEPEAMGRDPRADDHGGEVYVYRREGLPCLVCGTPVRRREVAGRNLFWCPGCQRDR